MRKRKKKNINASSSQKKVSTLTKKTNDNSNISLSDTERTNNPDLKKSKKIIVIGSLIFIVIGCSSILCYNTSQMKDITYEGIYIDNFSLGHLDKTNLTSTIEKILSEKLKQNNLILKIGNKSILANLSEIGVSYNIDLITDDILNFKKSNNIFLDTFNRLYLLTENYNYIPKATINEDILSEYINVLSEKYSIDAENSKVSITGSKLTTTHEKYGQKLDSEKLKNDILKTITNNSSETEIEVNFIETKPILTEETAKKMVILGSYKTPLTNKNKDRTSNIKLFLNKLNMSVIAPNEEFSCNKTAGSRERSDGYKAAPGYVNGEVVPIIAGGICQGTSTIYNALLYSDLEITERHPHSMPVTYVSNGRDAAIAGTLKDLKFKNNTNNPIILHTYVSSDGYVVANIWGIPEEENKKIEISVNHINSKAADTYKKTYLNGKLIKTELLSRDRYK